MPSKEEIDQLKARLDRLVRNKLDLVEVHKELEDMSSYLRKRLNELSRQIQAAERDTRE